MKFPLSCHPEAAPHALWRVDDLVGGKYTVRKLLGRGGMSAVWEADDLCLRRRVALKVLDVETDRIEPGGGRLMREARALAAVRHVGLPTPYGLEDHCGSSFLALERLYGVTVEDRVLNPDRHAVIFGMTEVIALLVGIADVLAAVHTAGMAHHDVKPGNVMLCERGRVVLLDFGNMITEVDVGHAATCGTPKYLAPEVFVAEVQPGQAHLLDIYAFGVTAFQVLTGQLPFIGDLNELCEQHATGCVPDPTAQRPETPPALAELISACLAKSPSDRPAAEEIEWELRRIGNAVENVPARRRRRESPTRPINMGRCR